MRLPPFPPPYHAPLIPVAPLCASCGVVSVFECALMPTLVYELSHFGPIPAHVEFGLVALFTCPDSCQPREGKTSFEHCLVQEAL